MERITKSGFREASHITRDIRIYWDQQSLLNLVIRRAVHNEAVREFYTVDAASVLGDTAKQKALFYRVFQQQVDAGKRKPTTFDWMLSRTTDGLGQSAPRELIHLLNAARDAQLKLLELGNPDPPGETLFDPKALKMALPEVSKVRFEQTLCAEFPDLAHYLRKLEREKTEQSPESLSRVWNLGREQTLALADRLSEVGFFEKRGAKEQPSFWVPFIYRDALDMVQGAAEENGEGPVDLLALGSGR